MAQSLISISICQSISLSPLQIIWAFDLKALEDSLVLPIQNLQTTIFDFKVLSAYKYNFVMFKFVYLGFSKASRCRQINFRNFYILRRFLRRLFVILVLNQMKSKLKVVCKAT